MEDKPINVKFPTSVRRRLESIAFEMASNLSEAVRVAVVLGIEEIHRGGDAVFKQGKISLRDENDTEKKQKIV